MDKGQAERNAYEAAFWDAQVSTGRGFRRYFYSEINELAWGMIMPALGSLRNAERVLAALRMREVAWP